MGEITQDEALRKAAFVQHFQSDITADRDGVGGGSDSSVTDWSVMIWFSAADESVGWDSVEDAMDELTRRADDLGLEWSLNDEYQQREWGTDTEDDAPYSGEFKLTGLDAETISTYEDQHVDGSLPDEPENAFIYRDQYDQKH